MDAKIQILHVNQLVIRSNLKNSEKRPPIIIRQATRSNACKAQYCHEAELTLADGTIVGRLVYRPDTPLDCGARLWLEVYDQLVIVPHVWEETQEPS